MKRLDYLLSVPVSRGKTAWLLAKPHTSENKLERTVRLDLTGKTVWVFVIEGELEGEEDLAFAIDCRAAFDEWWMNENVCRRIHWVSIPRELALELCPTLNLSDFDAK